MVVLGILASSAPLPITLTSEDPLGRGVTGTSHLLPLLLLFFLRHLALHLLQVQSRALVVALKVGKPFLLDVLFKHSCTVLIHALQITQFYQQVINFFFPYVRFFLLYLYVFKKIRNLTLLKCSDPQIHTPNILGQT